MRIHWKSKPAKLSLLIIFCLFSRMSCGCSFSMYCATLRSPLSAGYATLYFAFRSHFCGRFSSYIVHKMCQLRSRHKSCLERDFRDKRCVLTTQLATQVVSCSSVNILSRVRYKTRHRLSTCGSHMTSFHGYRAPLIFLFT